jgi:acetyltransferase
VDSAVAIFVPPLGIRQEDVAESIVRVAQQHHQKPVLAVLMGTGGPAAGQGRAASGGIPAYIFSRVGGARLAALRRHREWRARPDVPARDIAVDRSRVAVIAARARAAGRTKLSEVEALEVLAAYGIPAAPARLARTADEAARAAAEIGFPVVLKIVSPQIIHKTDVGGVRPNVDSVTELKMACAEMLDTVRQRAPTATIDGILVQRMIDGGRETIAGITRDPSFGPLVMFGLGGVFVEAIRDVVFRIAPIRPLDAHDMLRAIRGVAILDGIRGAPAVDFAALADALLRVSQLAMDAPEIAELDINPLLAFPDRVVAVDARVLVRE